MTRSGTEFAPQATDPTKTAPTTATTTTTTQSVHNCDILLGNFQIKKKRYRVLLHHDHIVWERLDSKRGNEAVKHTKKEAEIEAEQLSHRATYGSATNVVHVNEIIKVAKGATESAALQATAPLRKTAQQEAPQPQPPNEQYLCIHYAERIVSSPIDCNRWRVRSLTLFNADTYIIRQWHTMLSKMLNNSGRYRVHHLLVFINPFGGRKQGLQVYERHCKPLFQLAGIDASCIITQRANQIRDILMSHDLAPYDAVCCVGGDGTVAEVINGLLFRTMHDLGLDVSRPEYIPKPTLPICIIPAGSTDAVAYSLHGTADVPTAAIHLLLGQRRGLDICSVHNSHGIVRFCASSFSYGFLGDVLAKSENYRWMGTKRYEYVAVKAFLMNCGYEAEIRLLLPPDDGTNKDISNGTVSTASTEDAVCYADCQHCLSAVAVEREQLLTNKLAAEDETDMEMEEQLPTSSNASLFTQKSNDESGKKVYHSSSSSTIKVSSTGTGDGDHDVLNLNLAACDRIAQSAMSEQQNGGRVRLMRRQSALSLSTSCSTNGDNATKQLEAEADRKWRVIKGQYFLINVANVTCACTRAPHGIAPYNHLGDGYLHLVLARKTTLLNSARLLMETMGRNGDVRTLPFVEVHRTKEFRFRPYPSRSEDDCSFKSSCQPITEAFDTDNNHEKVSTWNCDGELVHDLDVIMRSHCQLIDVFMRGPYAYSQPTKHDKNFKLCGCCRS